MPNLGDLIRGIFGKDDEPAEDHEPLVDDESLGDPRFIHGARQALDWAIQDGQPKVAEHLASELDRAQKQGHNIWDSPWLRNEGGSQDESGSGNGEKY